LAKLFTIIAVLLAPALLIYVAGSFIHMNPAWADESARSSIVLATAVWTGVVGFIAATLGGL
jgi:hypothetical protein